MNEVLAIYDFLNNYGIVTLIRIAIGIILILNKKSISILNNKNTPKRFKFALVTTYYAVILWCMLFGWIYPSMKSVILGIIVGIVFSFIIVKYSATEHMAGWIFLIISFYEIAEFVFYGLDISFGEILKSNSYIYDDFDYDSLDDDYDDYPDDTEPGYVKSRKELKREEKRREREYRDEEREIKAESKRSKKEKRKIRTGGFVDEIDEDDFDTEEDERPQRAVQSATSEAHELLKKEIAAATAEDHRPARRSAKPAAQTRKAAPKKRAVPEVIEEEAEEPVEIKKLAIPRYSPAQLAAKAKKEGDAPDIVKDEITKVTLFDYSDIFTDDEDDDEDYYEDED